MHDPHISICCGVEGEGPILASVLDPSEQEPVHHSAEAVSGRTSLACFSPAVPFLGRRGRLKRRLDSNDPQWRRQGSANVAWWRRLTQERTKNSPPYHNQVLLARSASIRSVKLLPGTASDEALIIMGGSSTRQSPFGEKVNDGL